MLSPTEKKLLELTKDATCVWFNLCRETAVITELYQISGTSCFIETKTEQWGSGKVIQVTCE